MSGQSGEWEYWDREALTQVLAALAKYELPRPAREALHALSTGGTPPCRAEPERWEPLHTGVAWDLIERETPAGAAPRVREAIRRCREECAMLDACTVLRHGLDPENPQIIGVLGGELVQRGNAAEALRRMLER